MKSFIIGALLALLVIAGLEVANAEPVTGPDSGKCFQATDEFIISQKSDVKKVREAGLHGQIVFEDEQNYYSYAYRKGALPQRILVSKAEFEAIFEFITCPKLKPEL